MLCRRYNKVFNILLSLILLFGSIPCAAGTSKNLHSINGDIVVGLLKTEEETYPHEDCLSKNIREMFSNWEVKTVLIDYSKIISIKKIQVESLSLAKQDEILARWLTLDRIRVKLAEFIREHGINRIFILGNYCNLHSQPFPPNPYRQLVTEAIVKVVDDNPTIHLLGVCGSLQGIMNAKEIEVVNVSNLVSNEEKQRCHLKSAPDDLQQESATLQQIKIVPNSHLAEVVAKFLPPDENGWFSTYFPDANSGAVSNTTENRKKLKLLGYKVVAFSTDGIIEAIEDNHGNIYFQSHPEALVIEPDKNLCLENYKARQVSMLVAIAIINDFLYHT